MKKAKKKVKDVFSNLPKNMINSLAGSVISNNVLLKRENDAKKVWQETYYQDLFMQFREAG